MLRRTLLAGLMLAPMILSACDNKDAAGPQGTNAAVTINAFVDANGSGVPDAGDVFLNSKTVTLTSTSGTALTATTDANGVATFAAVPPGSYVASIAGDVPSGAVLATAPSPVIVVPFQGGTLSSEFRYVFNPGSISGQLFRDNNASGTFNTGDTPAPGMTVLLYNGTDTTATALATTTTDNNGVFTFNVVRPGSYTVKVSAIPTITIVGGTTQAVTVVANTPTLVPVKFTGNLISSVADARAAALKAPVAFEGIVTNNQQAFTTAVTSSGTVYVQDATGGIQVFGLPATQGIAAGDSVRVIGTRDVFGGEVEVTTSAAGQGVTKLGTKTVPAAKVLTIAQVLSGAFQGQLVTTPNVTVTNVAITNAGTGATTVSVRMSPAPGDTFQIRVAGPFGSGINTSVFVVGRSYDVTGELGQSNAVVQLKPRSPSDITIRSAGITIEDARQHADNDTVTVEGVIYLGTDVLTSLPTSVRNAYIMDNTGGALIFGVPAGTTLVNGDSIRIKALVAHFPLSPNGEFELSRFSSTSPPIIEKLGSVTPRAPLTITAAALASRNFDGSLVKVFGATVNTVGTASSTGGFNVTATGSDGTTFTIRVGNTNVGLTPANFTVGQRIDVAGAALNFIANAQSTTSTPEILVRSPADVTPSVVPANLKTIAQARTIATTTPDTVTVLGIVTAARGAFRNDNAYIFDGTAGVQVFGLPASLSLNVGDAVLVHGKSAPFVSSTTNDVEIINNSTTDSIKVTKIGTHSTIGPEDITGAEMVARVGESQLVRLQDVTVTSIGTPSGTSGAYTVNGKAADGTAVLIFMSAPTLAQVPPTSLFTVGGHYDLTGIEVPFITGGNNIGELKPRGAFDVVAR